MEINIQCKGIDESKIKVNVDFINQSGVNIRIQSGTSEIIDRPIQLNSIDADEIQSIKNEQSLNSIYQSLFTFIVSHCTAGAVFLLAVFYLYKDYIKISHLAFTFDNANIIIGFYFACLIILTTILLYGFLIYKLYIKTVTNHSEFKKTRTFIMYGFSFWGIVLAPIFYALLTLPKI